MTYDLFEKFKRHKGPIGSYQKRIDGYFTFPKLEGPIANRMCFKGREKIVWSINDYLGLANHPEVRAADAAAAKAYGLAAPMGARMMTGNTDLHEQLEKELAAFVHKPAAFLLNYGYQGIMSIIDCLCDRYDVVVYDAECHASIIDGMRLHLGKRFVFKHNDIADCERQLGRAYRLVETQGKGGILVISEGVFGMSGDQGKIKEIAALRRKYPFRLLVDDAHGFGVLGATGYGVGEAQGCQDAVDLYFSTFAKSMASIGAFVAGSRELMDIIRYNVRSQIFAKSLPLPLVAGHLKRLSLLRKTPALREKLWRNVHQLQNGFKERGLDIGLTNTPVTPVYMKGGVEEAMNVVIDLRENKHIFCSMIVYPVIPKGQIIYRIIPTATHTEADITETLQAFSEIKTGLDKGLYQKEAIVPLTY